MAYTVKAHPSGAIQLAPASMEEEILQNVTMTISTPKFTVPLYRGFGLAQRFVDQPVQAARALLISEVMDAIEKYEPRVKVVSVAFEDGESPGTLIPVVEVKIIDK